MKAAFHGSESRLAPSAKLYRYLLTDLGAEGLEGGQEARDEKGL